MTAIILDGTTMQKNYYTVLEVSKMFDVSRQAVYNWVNEGRLKAIKVGERIRIPKEAVDSFIRPAVEEVPANPRNN